MSDRFHPVSMEQLTHSVFTELRENKTLFGFPRDAFFVPQEDDLFRSTRYGQLLETPFGVAAGPHTQLARNIIAAWTCGARFIELKTVQTLDELNVPKPCIDMEDEGYNVEWSQELKIHQSIDEYIKAWVLLHALHIELGFPGVRPGVIFNLSVGYNLAGIMNENVQWFLKKTQDCSAEIAKYVDIVAKYLPAIRDVNIPGKLSDNITLSTMHGCPPHEIEKIAAYLIKEWGFHTTVKLNPTLLGKERVREILNEDLGFEDTIVPDEAFGHDLKYPDAVPMLTRLQALAKECNVDFAVKLTNTLEVQNHRNVFSKDEKMMYMSGRALHAISTNLAAKLSTEFDGKLEISYAGGADAFNVPDLLRCGFNTVTVSSDLLKPGGYLRMVQYIDNLREEIEFMNARSLKDYVVRSAIEEEDGRKAIDELAAGLSDAITGSDACYCEAVAKFAETQNANAQDLIQAVLWKARLMNQKAYAETTPLDEMFQNGLYDTGKTKGSRQLGFFDCIKAPCTTTCPVDQKVPGYMRAIAKGDFNLAARIARADNPIASTLSRICDHKCTGSCVRTHYDAPLQIREIKRAAVDLGAPSELGVTEGSISAKTAVIGAGPCGLAVARELARAGAPVDIYEQNARVGGVAAATIPVYRLPIGVTERDLRAMEGLGVNFHFGMKAGRDFTLESLKADGYKYIVLAVGAQAGRLLGFEGEDAKGVYDALDFLRQVHAGYVPDLGSVVGIVGAGDVAMDAARTVYRLGKKPLLIYRRTLGEAPASDEELIGFLEEEIETHELASPKALIVEDGRLKGLICQQMELTDPDASGRCGIKAIEGEEIRFELDSLIVAVSQKTVLDFFGADAPKTDRGFIAVNADLETSVANVFSGGDVADKGPATAVKAASDGKKIAAVILQREGAKPWTCPCTPEPLTREEMHSLIQKRAIRVFPNEIEELDLDKRQSFSPLVQTLSRDAAQEEASRCLACDRFCSICVSVCPNRAFLTYEAPMFEASLPRLIAVSGQLGKEAGEVFKITQFAQTAVLADNCNECGNCRTFCPTEGAPYKQKPRIYFDRSEFDAEGNNAFIVTHEGDSWSIEGKFDGKVSSLSLGDEIVYKTDAFTARFESNFEFVGAALNEGATVADDTEFSLVPAATLYTLLAGLKQSAAYAF